MRKSVPFFERLPRVMVPTPGSAWPGKPTVAALPAIVVMFEHVNLDEIVVSY